MPSSYFYDGYIFSDCLEGCNDCRESWRGGSSICSACESKDLVPSGSECLEECRPGQYLEHKACKGWYSLGIIDEQFLLTINFGDKLLKMSFWAISLV